MGNRVAVDGADILVTRFRTSEKNESEAAGAVFLVQNEKRRIFTQRPLPHELSAAIRLNC